MANGPSVDVIPEVTRGVDDHDTVDAPPGLAPTEGLPKPSSYSTVETCGSEGGVHVAAAPTQSLHPSAASVPPHLGGRRGGERHVGRFSVSD